jgi:hypothetical protein
VLGLIVTRAFSIICGASLVSICLVCTLFGQTAPYPSESASALVQQFENTPAFWKQFQVAKKIVALRDKSVLQELEPELSNMDMHRRGNAAFIFAGLGDDRGFQRFVDRHLSGVALNLRYFLGRVGSKLQKTRK